MVERRSGPEVDPGLGQAQSRLEVGQVEAIVGRQTMPDGQRYPVGQGKVASD